METKTTVRLIVAWMSPERARRSDGEPLQMIPSPRNTATERGGNKGTGRGRRMKRGHRKKERKRVSPPGPDRSLNNPLFSLLPSPTSPPTVTIPDDRAFASFKAECLCEEGWSINHNKGGITVFTQGLEEGKSIHKIKCRMVCKDVSAETMYDVLHDIEYRRKWDTNVIETFDIGKLTVNADVGYYSWKCPSPLRNRDVITLRSWLPMGKDYIIMKLLCQTSRQGASCVHSDWLRDPEPGTGQQLYPHLHGSGRSKGFVTQWVVNKSSHFLAPRAMKKINKACLKYTEWKQRHNPGFKPWLYPEQTTLPSIPLIRNPPICCHGNSEIDSALKRREMCLSQRK
ncbi:hypothetical protein F7725_020891 [Dissostichus mawsoni]|uniref:START domain-containing protein n=1 Tax=Dissostichus mawsoni TaxID=36200 RepID=A0A7J5YFE4_DISMA|nr:hypothetical protein F7725_020891 [Dissostichus mawsoni]